MSTWTKVKRDGAADSDKLSWNPEELPEVEGTLVDNRLNIGIYQSTVWDLETVDGITYTVWASTVLAMLLGKVPMGSYVKIIYKGKKKMKKGVGFYKDFDVFVSEKAPEASVVVEEVEEVEKKVAKKKKAKVTVSEPVSDDDDYDELPF